MERTVAARDPSVSERQIVASRRALLGALTVAPLTVPAAALSIAPHPLVPLFEVSGEQDASSAGPVIITQKASFEAPLPEMHGRSATNSIRLASYFSLG